MFGYKRLLSIFFLGIVISVEAMDSDSAATGMSSLAGQSDEMKVKVICALPFVTGNVQQAALTIKALAISCKGFYQIINDDRVTKNLVRMLVLKFDGYH